MTDLLRRRADDLSTYAAELLNRDCVFGVEFADMRELVEGLVVLHPPATYLLSGTELAEAVPSPAIDPVLFYLHLLVAEARETTGEVPLWRAVEHLRTFGGLAANLAEALNSGGDDED